MERKHDGHALCKVKITNIKNDFGLGCCNSNGLGRLWCYNDFCVEFVSYGLWNEVHQTSNSTHVPIVAHFGLSIITCALVSKFCGVPFCVDACEWKYIMSSTNLSPLRRKWFILEGVIILFKTTCLAINGVWMSSNELKLMSKC